MKLRYDNCDLHNYAEETRARKYIRFFFSPVLRILIRWLLIMCPDDAIVANVHIGMKDCGITLLGKTRANIINVRLEDKRS